MKKTLFAICSIVILTSCQTEAGKKATEERIKAENSYDSIHAITTRMTEFLECKIDLMTSGSTDEYASKHCAEIYPEGYLLDSISSLKDTIK
jgi:hypothetical protein